MNAVESLPYILAQMVEPVASSELINRVYNLLSQRAPMTTWLKVKSAGKVQIILEMEVYW